MSIERPDYFSDVDKKTLDELLCKEFDKRTQLEDEFIKSMYHQEMFYYDSMSHGSYSYGDV